METESVLSSLRAHQMPTNYYIGGKTIGNEPNNQNDNGDNCEAWSCTWIEQTVKTKLSNFCNLKDKVCVSGAEDACLKIWDFRSINSM